MTHAVRLASSWARRAALVITFAALGPRVAAAQQALEPIVYTVRIPAPAPRVAEVEARVPTGGRATVEMMVSVWTPGYYRVEDYASRIHDVTARAPDGTTLTVEQPRKNRWRVHSDGRPTFILSYRLTADGRSVTTNWIEERYAILNGAPTFITLVERARRPHDVRLELPAHWARSMTGLSPAPGGAAHHYRADDYDTLVDSPILAGELLVNEFAVDGSTHYLVDAGDVGSWDGRRGAQDLEKIVQENRRFWGFLPFKRYVFLNVFRQGGGGLEHMNSTLLTSNASRMATPRAYFSWLAFVSHEYFHAFNVKRLRPVELGPFDYEQPPRTSSLWISEGLTTYFADLATIRAGLGGTEDYLATLSGHIRQLQTTPGRLVQTLEQSSLDVWNSGVSGVGQDPKTTISYYIKGPVVGFVLDAHIRRTTGGRKSMDDVIRLAYQRHSGARGFTPDEFRKAAEDVAGVDLRAWFRKALVSTEELDYTEALEWFGLQFEPTDDPAKGWNLVVRPDATDAQRDHLRTWLAPSAATAPPSARRAAASALRSPRSHVAPARSTRAPSR
jgi:predicted metalloprotease with PDZ domain